MGGGGRWSASTQTLAAAPSQKIAARPCPTLLVASRHSSISLVCDRQVVAPPLVKAISVAFEGRLLVAQVSPAQMEIRKVYLESRGLEPPAVLLLPGGVASAEKALVYRGGLERAEGGAARQEGASRAIPTPQPTTPMRITSPMLKL